MYEPQKCQTRSVEEQTLKFVLHTSSSASKVICIILAVNPLRPGRALGPKDWFSCVFAPCHMSIAPDTIRWSMWMCNKAIDNQCSMIYVLGTFSLWWCWVQAWTHSSSMPHRRFIAAVIVLFQCLQKLIIFWCELHCATYHNDKRLAGWETIHWYSKLLLV
jgi:hypothetical protein